MVYWAHSVLGLYLLIVKEEKKNRKGHMHFRAENVKLILGREVIPDLRSIFSFLALGLHKPETHGILVRNRICHLLCL